MKFKFDHSSNFIKIFLFDSENHETIDNSLIEFLSKDEIQKLYSISSPMKGKQYLLSRILLRKILSNIFTEFHPKEWQFYLDKNLQPQLAQKKLINFSLSHCNSLNGIAISNFTKIGLDIETLRPLFYDPQIFSSSSSLFSSTELLTLNKLQPSIRAKAALKIWTCKEAYFKMSNQIFQNPSDCEINLEFLRLLKAIDNDSYETHFKTFEYQFNSAIYQVTLASEKEFNTSIEFIDSIINL